MVHGLDFRDSKGKNRGKKESTASGMAWHGMQVRG